MRRIFAIVVMLVAAVYSVQAGNYKYKTTMSPFTGKLDMVLDGQAIFAQISGVNAAIPTPCTGSTPIYDGAESIVPGPRGIAGQITSVSATTGAAGSSASVVNTGSLSEAILSFTIPRGDKGEQGIQGIQGSSGIGANALFCNISGAVRTVTYAADGTTPYPSALSTYVVQVWNGATRLIADTWAWWTGGASNRIYNSAGSSTASSYQPRLKPTFSHLSSNNYIGVQIRYSSAVGKRYCVTGLPIPVSKIGTTGATGAAGTGGGSAPGGALNSIQYKYSSAATKKIFRGFGRYSVHATGGVLIL